MRSLTARPFAVNLFAPLPPPVIDEQRIAEVQALLAPHRERLGLGPATPPARPPWRFEDQLAVVVEERVPVFSFTFGIPPLEDLGDAVVLGTATTAAEAAALEQAGAHVVVAQGREAGGHRGTFLGSFEDGLVALDELVPAAAEACSLPVVAAGGLMSGADVARAIELGASAAQAGTAFLFCAEANVPAAWRQALRERETVVTDAYTGRPCRGARTPFLEELMASEPADYPLQAALLAELRPHDGYGFYMGGTGAARAPGAAGRRARRRARPGPLADALAVAVAVLAVDRHAVVARAAVDDVARAVLAVDVVVAGAADQVVAAEAADDHVVAVAADELVVALRRPASSSSPAPPSRSVVAGVAEEHVVAALAEDLVVAVVAAGVVVAAVGVDDVVAVLAVHRVGERRCRRACRCRPRR